MLTMEEALKQSPARFATGQIVKGTVIEVRPKEVLVDIGYKSEGVIPGNEFDDIKTVKPGDEVDVLIEKLEDKEGMVVLSKEKAEFKKNWDKILTICNEGGTITGKVKAAVDARVSRDTLIIVRTDAVAVEGFEGAMARAALYRDAGADMLFVEAPRQRDELGRIGMKFGKSVPLMANMVEGGKTPMLPASELQALGFALVIFPGGIVRTLAKAAEEFYASLKAHGSTEPFRARMFDFEAINRLLGTPEMLERGARYVGEESPKR